jgi:hypothetical protein
MIDYVAKPLMSETQVLCGPGNSAAGLCESFGNNLALKLLHARLERFPVGLRAARADRDYSPCLDIFGVPRNRV